MRRMCLAVGVWALAATAMAAETPDPAKWRALDPEQTLYIDTTQGRVVVEMFPEVAPLAVARVKELARQKFYDGLTFHRVMNNFMAQGGDPKGDGSGGSKLPDLPEEFMFRRGKDMAFQKAANQGGATFGFYKSLPIASQPDDMMAITKDGKASAWGLHCVGVAAMAREAAPDTANSQFYLMRATYPSLDKRYTVWGRVVWGQDSVNKFAIGEPPPIPDKMIAVRVAADLPVSERAPIYVVRTDSKAFEDTINDVRKKAGADFSVCDVPIAATVADTQERGRAWWHKIPLIP
ncbi:MAG: peptidylprolyl isomerase [Alphaproteobacteria bacterium]